MPRPAFPIVRLGTARLTDHPWIFRKMLRDAAPGVSPGDRVTVVDRSGAVVGQALFNPRSQIALRMLEDRGEPPIDGAWLEARLADAVRLRREALGLDAVTDAWRVVHAEGDGLSGLVVDRFGPLLSVEIFALGMQRWLPDIVRGLQGLFPGAAVHVRLDKRAAELEGMAPLPETKPPGPVEIREHGLRFRVDAAAGHKTGFFCDQRDNRLALRTFVRGRSVLDAFCYSGGFALSATAGGAASVTAVDLDEKILEVAKGNARLNGAAVAFEHADVFDFLRAAFAAGRTWQVIVLDPAKFARSKEGIPAALRSYEDLNRLALQVLAPGGILVTCSCSGAVHEQEFMGAVHRASRQAGRKLDILMRRGAAPDHPVALPCPETGYLKALFCRAR